MDIKEQLRHLAIASFTDEECPDADLLAAFALHQLAGTTEELRVAAHMRTCSMCTYDVALCRSVEAKQTPGGITWPPQPEPAKRRGSSIARLLPALSPTGRRSGTLTNYDRRYKDADLIIDLTIPPPEGDYWHITGGVQRNDIGIKGCTVLLQAGRRRFSSQITDELGIFRFEQVPAGRYTITVNEGQVRVQIRDLDLSH